MSETIPATEATKTAIEDAVHTILADKVSETSVPIVTQKFMTNNNLLVYVTLCSTPELNAPRLKVQVLQRVDRGVHETGYQMYGDHRWEKYENDMIFGAEPGGADGSSSTPVSEDETGMLLGLLRSLKDISQIREA